jgi:hypothetical protein
VGGAIGGVVGGVNGVFGIDQRPRFHSYVVERHYDVPSEYGVRDYRYTVVNGRTVLVDPRTHSIVEVIE